MFKKTFLIREVKNKHRSDRDMSVVPISVLTVELPGAEPHKLWLLGPDSSSPTAATLPAIYWFANAGEHASFATTTYFHGSKKQELHETSFVQRETAEHFTAAHYISLDLPQYS